VWRRLERKQAEKLVGQDKGSFNRTTNKGNRNNNDTGKEKTQKKPHNPESCPPQSPPRAPEPRVPSRCAASTPQEPSMTAHGMKYPALFGQAGFGSAHPAVPFLDSGEN